MYTVTNKSITDSTVSSTNPDNYDPHDSMGKVGYSIEQLDIILYQVISCKSKLDEIFRHLSICSEENRSVSMYLLVAAYLISYLRAKVLQWTKESKLCSCTSSIHLKKLFHTRVKVTEMGLFGVCCNPMCAYCNSKNNMQMLLAQAQEANSVRVLVCHTLQHCCLKK